jgi:hypothetical protein
MRAAVINQKKAVSSLGDVNRVVTASVLTADDDGGGERKLSIESEGQVTP